MRPVSSRFVPAFLPFADADGLLSSCSRLTWPILHWRCRLWHLCTGSDSSDGRAWDGRWPVQSWPFVSRPFWTRACHRSDAASCLSSESAVALLPSACDSSPAFWETNQNPDLPWAPAAPGQRSSWGFRWPVPGSLHRRRCVGIPCGKESNHRHFLPGNKSGSWEIHSKAPVSFDWRFSLLRISEKKVSYIWSCLSGICVIISNTYSTFPEKNQPQIRNFLQFSKNILNVYKASRPHFSGRTNLSLLRYFRTKCNLV